MQPALRCARLLILALFGVVAALGVAACGADTGGGGYGDRGGGVPAPPTAAPNPEEGATFVSRASVPGFGLILVDSAGRTLYGFDGDGGGESTCYGRCAAAWPPLLTAGEPHPSNGAAAAKLGTVERNDGTVQVTYAGRPLHTYAADKAPGEASGAGVSSFGGTWFALESSGEPAR